MQGGLITRIAKKLKRIIVKPFQKLHRKVKRILSPESFANHVVSDVKDGIKGEEKKQEPSLRD